MKKFLIILILLGIIAGYVLLNHHFILFDEKIRIVRKVKLTPNLTFVDARGAKLFKIAVEPDLIKAGIQEVLAGTKGTSIPVPNFSD
jgi:hypothetical protein